MGGYILLLPPKIPITIRLMTWLNYIHTYIHTYMHTFTSLPSIVLSVSMRDGVVVAGVLINEEGWMDRLLFWDDNRIAAQSANHFKEQLSSLALRSEETTKKITQN